MPTCVTALAQDADTHTLLSASAAASARSATDGSQGPHTISAASLGQPLDCDCVAETPAAGDAAVRQLSKIGIPPASNKHACAGSKKNVRHPMADAAASRAPVPLLTAASSAVAAGGLMQCSSAWIPPASTMVCLFATWHAALISASAAAPLTALSGYDSTAVTSLLMCKGLPSFDRCAAHHRQRAG
jgi:hypothetical protein